MTITEVLNAKKWLASGHSFIFWEGYRSFVLGGRGRHTTEKCHLIITDTSIEPPDEITTTMRGSIPKTIILSEANKQDWRNGVEYARKEREECLAIENGRQ